MFQTNGSIESLSKEIDSLSTEIKDIKKNQIKILELKQYNNENKKLNGWAQQQNGRRKEKK